MQRFTHFSRHAFERLGQRTSLTCEEVSELLDGGAYVNTGSKPGFNREHLVFYSVRDKEHFVAIRDSQSGTVVTVLPLAYHTNLAWPIHPADLHESRELATGRASSEQLLAKSSGAKNFVVSVCFDSHEGHQRTTSVLRISAPTYNWSMRELLIDDQIFDQILQSVQDKGICQDNVIGYLIRLGNKGIPVVVDPQNVSPNNSFKPTPLRGSA